ncbi:MAG: DUF3854 domain-containing protein [Polyangiales bacterium]
MNDRDELARAIFLHNKRQRRGSRRRGRSRRPPYAASSRPSGRRARRWSGDGLGGFERVSRASPCPICRHDSFCLVARDGAMVLCTRVQSDHHRPNTISDLWAHPIGERAYPAAASVRPAVSPPTSSLAPPELRDRAYRALLARMNLAPMDLAALERRGLSADAIHRGLYRTLSCDRRFSLARDVITAEGLGHCAWRIPGFRLTGLGGWTLAGAPGLLIPVLDLEGRVVALKIRNRSDVGPRYTLLSARWDGGAPAEAALHVPLRARELLEGGAEVLWITEGELKADVITELLQRPCVSVPGVGCWFRAFAAVTRWPTPGGVVIAFDMDRLLKPAVQRAQDALRDALIARGVRVQCAEWDRVHKGFDDFLAARLRPNAAANEVAE